MKGNAELSLLREENKNLREELEQEGERTARRQAARTRLGQWSLRAYVASHGIPLWTRLRFRGILLSFSMSELPRGGVDFVVTDLEEAASATSTARR
jgi:hypothetical protein